MTLLTTVLALKQYIDGQVPALNAALAPFGIEYQRTFPQERQAVDVESYPCVMLGNPTSVKRWQYSPYQLEEQVTLEMMGYLVWDDNDQNALALLAFASEFSLMWENGPDERIQLPGGGEIYYPPETPPLGEITVDYALIGDAFLRSFTASWTGCVSRPARFNRGIS